MRVSAGTIPCVFFKDDQFALMQQKSHCRASQFLLPADRGVFRGVVYLCAAAVAGAE